MRQICCRRQAHRALVVGLLGLGVLWLTPSLGAKELVIFTHGSRLPVAGYEVRDAKVRLELHSGGVLTVPLHKVDRIIDDPRAVEEPEPTPEPPAFEITFRDQPTPDVPYGELIHQVAQRHGLNPQLVAAVVRAESAFNPQAISVKGAQGLMQLMPATADRFGVRGDRVFDPETNLDAGSRYLAWLARRFDHHLPHMLAAYNAGEGTVDRYEGVPPYRETRGYLERIYRVLGLDTAMIHQPVQAAAETASVGDSR